MQCFWHFQVLLVVGDAILRGGYEPNPVDYQVNNSLQENPSECNSSKSFNLIVHNDKILLFFVHCSQVICSDYKETG
jgi:hypothetical protein